jgi:hypothetical protein
MPVTFLLKSQMFMEMLSKHIANSFLSHSRLFHMPIERMFLLMCLETCQILKKLKNDRFWSTLERFNSHLVAVDN